jgi:inhibitor of KinA
MLDYRVLPAGDTALVVEFGDRIDRALSARVLSLASRLNKLELDGVVETVPTIRSLLVYYEPLTLSMAALRRTIDALMQDLHGHDLDGRNWELPACYDASLAPDLADVAGRAGLSPGAVIERHSAVTYHVYMLGFLPGLAYLGDVPAELTLPRRESPRPRIPAGSIGIASAMTCVYPMETPCGWHLIARSPVPLWDRRRETGALLAPGDRVRFKPVSLPEYERLLSMAQAGVLTLAPTAEPQRAIA